MIRLFLSVVLLAGLAVHPAWAQPETAPLTPQAIGDLSLDELFETLSQSADSPSGKAVEAEILKRLENSGSDTADLLMSWAGQAVEAKTYPAALDILDQIIMLQPGYAEAWNKRATVYYLMDDYASSLADIRQTLAIEPRHFGALSGLGLILQDTGRKEQAMAVFRKALAIDPLLDKVRESLERLEKETERNAI